MAEKLGRKRDHRAQRAAAVSEKGGGRSADSRVHLLAANILASLLTRSCAGYVPVLLCIRLSKYL